MTERLVPLISARRIGRRVAELARQIEDDHRGQPLTLIVVLKGATVFAADLMRQIGIPFVIDFVRAASYGGAAQSSGTVVLSEAGLDLAGRHVIVVEDIVDSGLTIAVLVAALQRLGPKSSTSAPCCTRRWPKPGRSRSATRASTYRTNSWSATAWITPNDTATCRASTG